MSPQRAPGVEAPGAPAVARIPYLNTEPFYAEGGPWPGASVELVPRRLGEEARAGRVDAGPMAVVDFFSLEADFERLGNFAIACRGEVESVLLLAMSPLEEIERVRLTDHSSTSVVLCRLLLEGSGGRRALRFERGPVTSELERGRLPEGAEAWLVIGDAALAARRAHPQAVALDLGAAWLEWTGLPFVYAVWAVRRTLPAESRRALLAGLDQSLAAGETRLGELAARYAAGRGPQLGDAASLTRYLERFVYRLGPDEERGLAEFRRRCEEDSRVSR